MQDFTLKTYRATDFTPESFVFTVETVARALPDLETATIKAWQRAQPQSLKMKARVVVTGLHIWRKWQSADASYLDYAAHHVWAHKTVRVTDQGAYAELRRFLACPDVALRLRPYSRQWAPL
ncbi:hypothetical protein [Hyphomicrobium sp. CS1GBMeth3]|uniref:hypothetical protein n=1 Tax=Hyphomicrobium sp. CS1GBMeth3 TaxID=1892845 RepID=UPI001114FFCE|nr:hypothetical protein [Hyphomicrobium sp. CS1GBMeth3]